MTTRFAPAGGGASWRHRDTEGTWRDGAILRGILGRMPTQIFTMGLLSKRGVLDRVLHETSVSEQDGHFPGDGLSVNLLWFLSVPSCLHPAEREGGEISLLSFPLVPISLAMNLTIAHKYACSSTDNGPKQTRFLTYPD